LVGVFDEDLSWRKVYTFSVIYLEVSLADIAGLDKFIFYQVYII
jgi:hypothetical protein